MKKRTLVSRIYIAVLVFVLMGMTGCGVKKTAVSPAGAPTNSPTPTCTPTPKPEFTEEQWSYLQKEVSFSEEQIEEFLKVLQKEVEYAYSECFELEAAFAAYEAYVSSEHETVTSSAVIKNNAVDPELLYEYMSKNSAMYFSGNPNRNYKVFSEEEIREYCGMISGFLTEKLAKDPMDTNTLDYQLSHMVPVNYDWFTVNASVGDGFLTVSRDRLLAMEQEDELAIEKTICHECMHMLQYDFLEKQCGIAYKFEELSINPLYALWFVEGSAEWDSYEVTGEYMFYAIERGYMIAMAVAMFLDEQPLEAYNYGHDLYGFYDKLSCDGLISRKELANMMYAIELAARENTEFSDAYKKTTGNYFIGEEARALKQHYKDASHITLAKKLYYDLCRQTYTLEENFSLMTLFEQACRYNTEYAMYGYQNTPKQFLMEYMEIQQAYIRLLAESFGVTEKLLWDLYNTYFAEYNFKFDFTTQDERWNHLVDLYKPNVLKTANAYYREYFRE